MMRRMCLCLLLLLLSAAKVPQAQFDPFHEARIDDRPGALIPLGGEFRDEAGRETSLRRLSNGRPLILVPVQHDCPNFCGVTLAGLMRAVEAMPKGERPKFATVAFGIDPKEGPAAATGDLDRLRNTLAQKTIPPIHALTGSESAIRHVTDALGYHYAWDSRIRQYAHAAAIAIITPQGHLSRWFYSLSPDPNELRQALIVADKDEVGSWIHQLLLICCSYDPLTGQYTLVINKVLQALGVITVLGIGLAIVLLQRKAR
jgi:protein SCO1/2